MSRLLGSLAALGLAAAIPTGSNVVAKRQVADDQLWTCREAGCSDCPMYFSTGGGWPDCPYYSGEQLTDNGFITEENGQIKIFIDVPDQDLDCRALIRTPVRPNDQNCGGNVIVAEGATCAPIVIDNTFIASFCCGIDDCTAAGAPGKRDTSSANTFMNRQAGSGSTLVLHDKDGNVIEPHKAALLQGREPEPAVVKAREPKTLRKRDCEDWTTTRGPFQSGGTNYIISDTVSCSPTESCQAQIGEEVTETTSFSTEVSVSDPLGIVSASVGFEFSESVSQSFSGTWTFGPGERGYVVFIPYITCVEGYFSGDCDDDQVQTTICGGESSGDTITGERRAVLIRG